MTILAELLNLFSPQALANEGLVILSILLVHVFKDRTFLSKISICKPSGLRLSLAKTKFEVKLHKAIEAYFTSRFCYSLRQRRDSAATSSTYELSGSSYYLQQNVSIYM